MKTTGIGSTERGTSAGARRSQPLSDDVLGLYVVAEAAALPTAENALRIVREYVQARTELLHRIRSGYASEELLPTIAGGAISKASEAIVAESGSDEYAISALLNGRAGAGVAYLGTSSVYHERSGTVRQVSEATDGDSEKFEHLVPVEPGDRLVLATHGRTSRLLEPSELAGVLDHNDLVVNVRRLSAHAGELATEDDITVLVVRVRDTLQRGQGVIEASLHTGKTTKIALDMPLPVQEDIHPLDDGG